MSLSFIYRFTESFNEPSEKIGDKSRIHGKHTSTHFRTRSPNGRRHAEAEFLPLTGKTDDVYAHLSLTLLQVYALSNGILSFTRLVKYPDENRGLGNQNWLAKSSHHVI